jgi:hypothetical protein
MARPKTWVDVVAPIRQTLDVGAMLEKPVKFEHDGAKALSGLLLKMASALDMAKSLLEEKDAALERKDAVLEDLIKAMEAKP